MENFEGSCSVLRTENLVKRYGPRTVANHVSIDVKQGEIVGLLGPNGAGKTTTLRMLATLIKPDKGDAWVDGCSVVSQPEAVRSKIGFLTSELKLEDFFTPSYLFDFFSDLHHVEPAVAAQRKKEMFSRFGIDKFSEVKVVNLSTGMKQKVSLVISLVHKPDIIIFDEPTNGLDIPSKSQFRKAIAAGLDENQTVIISTHQVKDVELLLDHVAIIDRNKVVVNDKMDSLFSDNESIDLERLFLNKVTH